MIWAILRWVGIGLVLLVALWVVTGLVDDSFQFEGRFTDFVISVPLVTFGFWFWFTGRLARLFRKVG